MNDADHDDARTGTTTTIAEADLPLERDVFMRMLIAQLAGVLDDTVGADESAGFISMVGQSMGAWIQQEYRRQAGADVIERQLPEVLVDLKRRIQGDFFVISADEEKIVLGNRACPFGELVRGRPALCMMTSNVFGSIAADSAGYAKVDIEEAIAQGDAGCRVVVWLKDTDDSRPAQGREYFSSRDLAVEHSA